MGIGLSRIDPLVKGVRDDNTHAYHKLPFVAPDENHGGLGEGRGSCSALVFLASLHFETISFTWLEYFNCAIQFCSIKICVLSTNNLYRPF
jgi:hypothetical protein